MGKHFRIIPGGRGLKKDGLDEPADRSARVPQLRVIKGGGAQARFARPDFATDDPRGRNSATYKGGARELRRGRKGGYGRGRVSNGRSGSLWAMAPLTLVCSAAVFWGVWTLTDPAASPTTGVLALASASDTQAASFGYCHSGGGSNCVVDGDTFHYQGQKIRIADIDTPETHPSRCAEEARLGNAATQRLHGLLNAGAFTLEPIDRDEDVYGRKLRIVTRGGDSLGGALVDEGLARWYAGGRRPWC